MIFSRQNAPRPVIPEAPRGFTLADWERENPPKLLSSNAHVTLRMTAAGALSELFIPTHAQRDEDNNVTRDLFGCNFMKLDWLHLRPDAPDGALVDWEVSPALQGVACEADYERDVLPRVRFESLSVRAPGAIVACIRALAPRIGGRPLRGVRYELTLENATNDAVKLDVRLSVTPPDACAPVPCERGLCMATHTEYRSEDALLYVLSDGVADEGGYSYAVALAPGASVTLAAAVCLCTGDVPPLSDAETLLRASIDEMLPESRADALGGFGALDIPEDTWSAQFLQNACIQGAALMRTDPDGCMTGIVIGPQRGSSITVNREDALRCLQLHCLSHPEAFRGWIDFIERYMQCPEDVPFDENLAANMGLGFACGLYYRATGDVTFFRERPNLRAELTRMLERLRGVRSPDAHLYRTYEVSDGHTLMDYDFCTQVKVHRVLGLLAPVLEDCYGLPALAAWVRAERDALRADTLRLLKTQGPFGEQYAASTDLSRFALFIDGEDSDGAMSAYTGFTTPDDPAWINYLRHGLSPLNPIYEPESRGLIWLDDPNIGHTYTPAATAPSLSSRLAACRDRADARAEIAHIRSMADWDAALYWWIRPSCRRDQLCTSMWATACISHIMLTHYLGLDVDAPRGLLRFAPWSPWPRFDWRDVHLGSFHCDVGYREGERRRQARLRNLGDAPLRVQFALYAPNDAPAVLLLNGARWSGESVRAPMLDETLHSLEYTLMPGEYVIITLEWAEKGVRL